ncbi:uncharacterized protein LOC130945514 [Arachis stenosperma]|uniref:uncharacterized protein LOC130945514 n=1 Tax=Arachis stenosperma TaxID=217475 RepID=UPI0025AC783C|nr:uncharacterized protein LOC130945514 [Arachis stenosperma]
MYQRRPEVGRKAHRVISFPRSVGRKSPPLFQSNEERNGVRMDPCVRRSIPTLQRDPGSTTRAREAQKRRTALPIPGHNGRSAYNSPGTGRMKDPTANLLREQSATRSGNEVQQTRETSTGAFDLFPQTKQYFQGHQIVVRTDQGIRQILQKPDLAGRMMTWTIELSQYDLRYESRHAIKAQAMTDFLVEVTGNPTEEPDTRWSLHVDGASNQKSGGAGVILESPDGVVYEQSIKFEFPISNNQAEYEALLGGLALAHEVCSDSQVVTLQVNGSYQARDSLLQKYLEKVKELNSQFEEITIQHVPRERNTRADLLSKLASTKPGVGNRSLIQGMLKEPAVTLHLTGANPSWLDPIVDFLKSGRLSDDEKAAKALRREAAKYTTIQGQLFKKGLSQPLLKCLHTEQTDYVLWEVHEGCCGHHIRGKALARKLIRAGYYWPSMIKDSQEFVKKCTKCQENANFHRAPASELSLLTTSRPFAQWGVDILGPFPVGSGQVKYLIAAIDYYTKWIEAEALPSISSANCRKFLWRQVITRFGISKVVISDNGTQFTDKKFIEFLNGLGIKQKFSSVEHPQTNGQVESANKVILQSLKKRLGCKKGAWADELASILWSYRTTEQSTTGETPFRLTYGVNAMIPVKIGEPNPRLLLKGVEEAVEKDLIDEAREMAHLAEVALKQRIALRYNANVLKREFKKDDLVLRRNDIGLTTQGEGKLAANWEGPYRVKEVLGRGAYKLEKLDGREIPRTWNIGNLRRFYS